MENLIFTRHARDKMHQYNLSESRLKGVLRNPERKELGIAPRTVAIMQITGTKKHPTEIWLMYQITKSKIKNQKSKTELPKEAKVKMRTKFSSPITKIISAWRYPGRSPIGEPPPIPEDVLWEINELRNTK